MSALPSFRRLFTIGVLLLAACSPGFGSSLSSPSLSWLLMLVVAGLLCFLRSLPSRSSRNRLVATYVLQCQHA